MDFSNKLISRLFGTGQREYTYQQGNVDYLDGTCLTRPFTLTGMQRILAIAVVIAACIIGALFINNTIFAQARESELSQKSVEENLKRPGALESVPFMSMMINLSDEEIMDIFDVNGFTIYDATSSTETGNLTVYKLPDDVALEDASALLARGFGSMNASQASRLLNGSWFFSADRVGGVSMVVRYADFTTGDPQIAIQKALEREGFDPASITDSGKDDSGNTFQAGTLEAGDLECSWRISALPLSDMYSISGLPEDAVYVGIRVTYYA